MTPADIRPMGIGEVLDRAFQLLRHHFLTLFVTALIGTAPMILLYGMAGIPAGGWAEPNAASGAFGLALFALAIVMLVTMAVVWAALTRQTDQAVTGGPVQVGDGLRTGLGALFRLIGAGILAYLSLLGVMLPVIFLGGVVAALVGSALGDSFAVQALIVVGLTALVAAGLVLWTSVMFLMLPALVTEGLGPIRALRRANALAKGGRLRICATAVVAWLAVVLPTIGLPFLFGLGSVMWDPQAAGMMSSTQLYLYQAVTFIVSGVTTPFLAATMVLSYYDRRARREGYHVELASEGLPAGV